MYTCVYGDNNMRTIRQWRSWKSLKRETVAHNRRNWKRTREGKLQSTLNCTEFRMHASQTLRASMFQKESLKRLGVFPKNSSKGQPDAPG